MGNCPFVLVTLKRSRLKLFVCNKKQSVLLFDEDGVQFPLVCNKQQSVLLFDEDGVQFPLVCNKQQSVLLFDEDGVQFPLATVIDFCFAY